MDQISSRFVRSLLLAGVLCAARPCPVQAEVARPPRGALADRELTVVDRSDRAMNEIYISPTNTDTWGEDRLGEATLAAGRAFKVRLGRTRDCLFDVQVIYEDASREQRLGHDVCRESQVVFTGAGAQMPPSVLGAEHTVTLLNGSSRPIQQVFVSPAEATQWGDDLLVNRSISVGDTAQVTYHGACAADLRVVFDNRSAEERRGLDLCETTAIAIRPGWTTTDAVPRPGVLLTNHAGRSLVGFYLTPEGAAAPGADLLAAGVLTDGASLVLPPLPPGVCRFSAHAVFAGPQPDRELDGLDLCTSPTIDLEK